MRLQRREFLAAGLALNLGPAAMALAEQGAAAPDRAGRGANGGEGSGRAAPPNRLAKTTRLFKSPGLYPNALAVMTDAPGAASCGSIRRRGFPKSCSA